MTVARARVAEQLSPVCWAPRPQTLVCWAPEPQTQVCWAPEPRMGCGSAHALLLWLQLAINPGPFSSFLKPFKVVCVVCDDPDRFTTNPDQAGHLKSPSVQIRPSVCERSCRMCSALRAECVTEKPLSFLTWSHLSLFSFCFSY